MIKLEEANYDFPMLKERDEMVKKSKERTQELLRKAIDLGLIEIIATHDGNVIKINK